MHSNEFSYNSYLIHEKDLKYVPPYLKDVPETPNEVEYRTPGSWPTWLGGTLLRIGEGCFTIPFSQQSHQHPVT
ncbi:beta-carotene 15,15 monooxygenase [Fusarium globosum]|uniref:Beta-carotene 15,15 monooxygenase n=1 Tax=Fusarium globosum TaxID=78864 RepID=A0A8H5XKN1_9HYPO|nr:beta-carotene 15,15 monooxygenase [Fusarium globosum]